MKTPIKISLAALTIAGLLLWGRGEAAGPEENAESPEPAENAESAESTESTESIDQTNSAPEGVSLFIAGSNLDTPIRFGEIPWDAVVYSHAGPGADMCPCMSTNEYGGLSIGPGAAAIGNGAIQIGTGTNDVPNTVKIKDLRLADISGIASQMAPRLNEVSDVAGMKGWLAEFCGMLATGAGTNGPPVEIR